MKRFKGELSNVYVYIYILYGTKLFIAILIAKNIIVSSYLHLLL